MKKIVTLLLTAALAVTAATTAFADTTTNTTQIEPGTNSKQIDVTYTVAPQIYRNHSCNCNAGQHKQASRGNGNSQRCDCTQ